MTDDPWYIKAGVLAIATCLFVVSVGLWLMIFEFALWMFGR